MMWDDGNSAGGWVTPFPMVVGWVLAGVVFIAALVLLAVLTRSASAEGDDASD